MPNLTDSHEWFLLRKLAEWLSQIKAQYHTLPINEHRGIHIDADHIELELRYTFSTIQKFSQSLSPEKFISCQGVLEQLCSLFDRLVAHPKAHDDSKGEEYPHLEALVRDLVNGSKQRVLGLYSDTGNLRDYLIAITECNNALNRLLAPPPLESAIQSSRRERKKTPWKNGKRRDQTIYVLETLFKHFKCGIPHEVLLKLIKNPNEDFIVQILQLMLPSCPELKSWQEVQYDNADLDDHSISLISDICTEVQQYAGQGKALILHVKEYTLYGASAGPITFRVDPSSKHSLDQLIKSGAFERPDVKSLIIKTPSIKFTPKEKRKLAVQLGYCLMDFFDADFNSNRIHFFDCLRPNSEKVPYLALDSRFLSTKDSYNFHLGHPTLLSFAKLLLELEYGQVIELEISPDSNQNRIAWSDLMRYTDILESNTSDSYLLSIRSCLSFHQKIRMNLESFDLENDADLIIRKTLYRSVVRHLEAALTEATPLSHKRRRESSPVPFHSRVRSSSISSPLSQAAVQRNKKDVISQSIQDGRIQPPTDSGYASTRLAAARAHYNTDTMECVQEHVGKDGEDTQTEYSVQSRKTHSRQQIFISELATYIFNATKPFSMDGKTQKRIVDILPELLKAFSLKVGHHSSNANSEMHQDAMVFIHRNRNEISAIFADIGFDEDDQDLDEDPINLHPVSWQSRIDLLLPRIEVLNQEESTELLLPQIEVQNQDENNLNSLQDLDAEVEATDETWLVKWRDFILNTDAFEWLTTSLRKECELVSIAPDAIRTIANKVTSSLPRPRRITKKMPPPSHSVIFELDWDINHFFETQHYIDSPERVLEGIITLTGSCSDAQAVTCAQYLHQTWPLTGEVMLQLVKQVLINEKEQTCKLPDGTNIRARIRGFEFIVKAEGVSVTIVEVAELFGWLGAALRSSPLDNGLVYYTPVIKNIKTPPFHQPEPSDSSANIIYTISFELEEVPGAHSTANGQCWHGIFNNPVIVKGYPIPRRPTWDTGLEIPLNIMAGLARSQRIDPFGNNVFIKGFSTMAVPVKQEEGIIYWHLIYKQNGDRISYLENVVEQEKEMNYLHFEDFRHVLGWCSEARFYGASSLANYSVAHSKLGRPSATGALYNTSVSSGRLIVGGPSSHIGRKETPPHEARLGHIRQLEWIVTKFVLLWDERDKRGWLINGASALLHLVRASLKHDSEGDFKSKFLFCNDDLQESATPFTAKSAIHVLINDANRNLKLFEQDNGDLLLKHRISHFYNILEKLIDHQAQLARIHDKGLDSMPRNYLEGWDFEELAKRRKDPLRPYAASIEMQGKSWVDFTRAIQAVTLVGRGFGEIITSIQTDLCNEWIKLPTQQYYIASCISDLRDLIEEHSFPDDGHIRLGESTIWHTPTTIFGSCRCNGGLGGPCEPVQTLFPSKLSQSLQRRKQPIPEDDFGALIFGQNSTFPWIWGDIGYPQEGDVKELMPPPRSNGRSFGSSTDSSVGSTHYSSEPGTSIYTPQTTIRSVELQHTPHISERMCASEIQPESFSANFESSPKDGNSLHDSGVTRSEARINFGWPKCREGFEIALICALQIESDAVEALFDVYYEEDFSYGKAQGDLNAYTTGKMAGHNVVLAFMPGMGKVNSANVAAGFRASFPKIKLGIVVGICGGAPDGTDCEKEVLLGDVIISNAVIQYDFGRQFDNQSVRRDTLQDNLGRPNLEIRAFLKKIKGLRGLRTLKEKTFSNLEDLCARDDFKESSYPGAENDILHHPTYRHKHHNADACNVCADCQGPYDDVCDKALESSCADLGCQDSLAVSRSRIEKAKGATTSRHTPTDEELREARKPFIHFGTVVSGDSVMKSGHHRDEIAKREGAIAFEMEGAGVWDSFPTVVIKSVCDYADSHKNKMWQKYAAATAAACTKAFLEEWRMTC